MENVAAFDDDGDDDIDDDDGDVIDDDDDGDVIDDDDDDDDDDGDVIDDDDDDDDDGDVIDDDDGDVIDDDDDDDDHDHDDYDADGDDNNKHLLIVHRHNSSTLDNKSSVRPLYVFVFLLKLDFTHSPWPRDHSIACSLVFSTHPFAQQLSLYLIYTFIHSLTHSLT